MTIQNTDELQSVLLRLTVPNTETIKEAESTLKAYFKKPASMLGLVQILQSSQDPNARYLAGTCLRQKILSHWRKLNPQMQEELKQAFLNRLVQEPERVCRNVVAGVVSTIAKYTVPEGKWNNLFDFPLPTVKEPGLRAP